MTRKDFRYIILPVIAVLTCHFPLIAQRKSTLEYLYLQGNVLSMHSVTFKAQIKNSTLIKKDRIITDPDKELSMFFDSAGYVIKKTIYNPDGSIQYIIHKFYDYRHNMIREERCDEKDAPLTATIYAYRLNEAGFPIEVTKMNKDSTSNGKQVFELNSKGNITRSIHYHANGTVDFTQFLSYDADQHLTEYHETYADTIPRYKIEYLTGKAGKTVPEKLYNKKNNVYFIYKYEFNDKGDYTMVSWCKPNGKVTASWAFDYTYDEHGNWTKAIVRQQKKQSILLRASNFVTERKFEYYSSKK